MYQKCVDLLEERGVSMQDIVDCVVFLQKEFLKEIDEAKIRTNIVSVINKREVQHAILTGIEIDVKTEENNFGSPLLNGIIKDDQGLYGIDEVLAYGICNLYGSIALTNFGYIDRVKPGIIAELNSHAGGHCHTFLDDIVGAIAASAASKLAHG